MEIERLCRAEQDTAAAHRAHLHRNPELSGREFETLRYVRGELDRLGVPWEEIPDGGLLGRLKGRAPGRKLLLRSDLDALGIQEDPENLAGPKALVSRVDGVCHACGHDAHTAMLLTAAKVLAAHRDEWDGEILLLFERGEETSFGVFPILLHLRAHEPDLDGVCAVHVLADLEAGRLSANPGPVMTGAVCFDVTLHGQGGHSSRPDRCNHPLDCFAAIYQAMAALRQRYVTPYECLTYTVGLLQAGSKSNIIPESLRFAGLARFFDMEACGAPFRREFEHIVASCCATYRCTAEYGYLTGPTIPVINHPDCAAMAQRAVSACLGPDALAAAEPWMASESMAFYNYFYPGVLLFLGIRDREKGMGAEHHNGKFDLDSGLLWRGAAAEVAYALEFLNGGAPISFTPPDRRPEDLARLYC